MSYKIPIKFPTDFKLQWFDLPRIGLPVAQSDEGLNVPEKTSDGDAAKFRYLFAAQICAAQIIKFDEILLSSVNTNSIVSQFTLCLTMEIARNVTSTLSLSSC